MLNKGFTLLELIVVIVILGILATLGFTQYSKQVESMRLAEAKVRLGLMRQFATEYYMKNGSLTGMQDSDVGSSSGCTSSSYFDYFIGGEGIDLGVNLKAQRCTGGGKTPNVVRQYQFCMRFVPSTGESLWYCRYPDDGSSCFGYPSSY